MKEQSLTNRIRAYFIRHPDRFINGGDIERLAMQVGYKASNASRRLRELHEEGFLERQIEGKCKSVWYKLFETL